MAFVANIVDNWPLTLAFIYGLLVGSFLNVVIFRLPRMLQQQWDAACNDVQIKDRDSSTAEPSQTYSLVTPRSHCPVCKTPIRAIDNIPIISYLFLKGRCHACHSSVSIRYPIVELVTAIATTVVIAHFGPTLAGLSAVVLTWILIALTVIDFDTQLLPDQLTLPLLWLGLISNLFALHSPLESAVIGAVAGYLFFWFLFHVFRLLTGKEGMGYGDFKLLAALGAWVGWEYLPLIILLSSVVGMTYGLLGMLLFKRGKDLPFAFGPFLAVAGWIALLWGQPIIQAYWQWFA